jgi:NADH-quinone oxidoreductase subunit E
MTTNLAPLPRSAGRQFTRICSILDQHGRQPARLIPILQAVQEEYRYLPQEVLAYVATALHVPPARVFGVATFYAHFTLEPKGKNLIRLCDGTACHVKDSLPILAAVRRRLRLEGPRKTTPDLLFTVETVACLGACGLAPVMLVNDEVHGPVTPESAVQIIDNLLARETQP